MSEFGSLWPTGSHQRGSDVVVVGAGISGLVAASRARAAGLSVSVLEAQDRVGGRTLSLGFGSQRLDLGGQWIGPSQARIAMLARELGLAMRPQYDKGKHLFVLGGKVRAYRGTVPRLPLRGLIQTQRVLARIDRVAATISPQRPWATPDAITWDSMSVRSWAERYVRSRSARGVLFAIVRSIFCCEPGEVGFLYFLFYVRSAGGLTHLTGVHGGAQQDVFVGGAQQISEKLAARLAGDVHLGAAVRAIEQNEHGVVVYSDAGAFAGRSVIVAVPPTLSGRIAYEPPLPARRDQLAQRMPLGASIKFLARYTRPFWREHGCSGRLVADIGPVQLVFDDSVTASDEGVLVGLMLGEEARRWSAEGADARRSAVLADLGRFFGREATEALDYADKDWSADPWTRGCPVAIMPAGVITSCGRALREPCGRLHWAGTETASDWAGYMEGAVEAGDRAAREVIERLTMSPARPATSAASGQAPK